MKKLLFAVSTFATLSVQAQEAPKVTSAIIAFRGNEIVEAKGFIDEATTIIESKNPAEIKEKILAKYYYNRGLIYSRIASSNDTSISNLSDNAAEIASESILDLLEFETTSKKKSFTDKAKLEINDLANNLTNKAYAAYDEKDYQTAYNMLMSAYEFKQNKLFGEFAFVDTLLLYNSAYMATQMGDVDASIKIYQKLLHMNYIGITYTASDIVTGGTKQYKTYEEMQKAVEINLAVNPQVSEDVRPTIYLSLLNQMKNHRSADEYISTLTEARLAFPNNIDILNYELQSYLDKGDLTGVLNLLNTAIEKYPENSLYLRVKGDKLGESGDFEGAISAYNAALEIDPDYFDVLYNFGLLYLKKADTYVDRMNKVPLNQSSKLERLRKERESYFALSLPYFEKALLLKSDDIELLEQIIAIYYHLGNYDKVSELKKQIESIK